MGDGDGDGDGEGDGDGDGDGEGDGEGDGDGDGDGEGDGDGDGDGEGDGVWYGASINHSHGFEWRNTSSASTYIRDPYLITFVPNFYCAGKLGKYNGCWWHGSLRFQAISSYVIDHEAMVSIFHDEGLDTWIPGPSKCCG